ncbi:hypothetical protein [uncultured Dysgonomonas sp.]|uniref:Lipoprotein n=1 Tax=uncultured Dysgonomonas sp. TaxID=206096 RepID=A0A212JWA5_9BACT|nr:hypothetical protein [uncultured Dysgonomonas sp.]SBW03632.1 conserved hypothetical protein [uncultured Dysgonomonas sp.]
MKTKIIYLFALISAILMVSCEDYPVDDKGLLITDKATCYMSSFNLLGSDNQSVLVRVPTYSNGDIDTINCTVKAVAKYGTNLTHVKPYCGVTDDITVTPSMGKWIDFSTPHKFTLISGNRKIKKEYTITVTIQE